MLRAGIRRARSDRKKAAWAKRNDPESKDPVGVRRGKLALDHQFVHALLAEKDQPGAFGTAAEVPCAPLFVRVPSPDGIRRLLNEYYQHPRAQVKHRGVRGLRAIDGLRTGRYNPLFRAEFPRDADVFANGDTFVARTWQRAGPNRDISWKRNP